MSQYFSHKLILWLDSLHVSLFGHPMGVSMKKFLTDLSWSFWGGIIASAAMLGISIVGGRILGPEEFGSYNLALTWASIIMIPLSFGINFSSVRAVATSHSEVEKTRNISSASGFVLIASVITILLVFLGQDLISSWLRVSPVFVAVTIIFAITLNAKTILDGFVRGLGLFKYQFRVRLVEVVVTALAFIAIFFGLGRQDHFGYYMAGLIFGGLAVIALYFKKLRPYLKYSAVNGRVLKSQLSYGKVIFIGTILGIGFNSIDKIFIARYLSLAQLGIYGAYFTASTNLIAQLSQIFVNVFFPSISQQDDKQNAIKKINKLATIGFLPMFLGLTMVIAVIIRLFGAQYGFNWIYVGSFAFLGVLQIILTINSTLIMAITKELYRTYIIYLNVLNVIFLGIYAALAYFQQVSIGIILILLISNTAFSIAIQKYLLGLVPKNSLAPMSSLK